MNGTPPQREATGTRTSARSAARLAAVQGLYQIEIGAAAADAVVEEFRLFRLGARGTGLLDLDDGQDPRGLEVDGELFRLLMLGASAEVEDLDRAIDAQLREGWRVGRLEVLLKLILRCAVFELRSSDDVPTAVLIDEYVGLAAAFFEGKQPGLVNGLLDRLAREIRAPADDPPAPAPAVDPTNVAADDGTVDENALSERDADDGAAAG